MHKHDLSLLCPDSFQYTKHNVLIVCIVIVVDIHVHVVGVLILIFKLLNNHDYNY